MIWIDMSGTSRHCISVGGLRIRLGPRLVTLWHRVILTGAALFAPVASHADTLEAIKARGTLRACAAQIEPALINVTPQGCTQDCLIRGLIPEQVEAFARFIGVEPELQMIPWSGQFVDSTGTLDRNSDAEPALLASNTCDLFVSNLATLPWRMRRMDIVPLFENRMIMLAHKTDARTMTGLDDLRGRRVGVQPQSSFHTWLMDRNADVLADDPITIVLTDTDEPVDLLNRRQVDAVLTDADAAVLTMRYRNPDLAVVFAVGDIQELGWGMSRRYPALKAAVADFFSQQRETRGSALNTAWVGHIGLTIPQFEELVRSLPK